MLPKVAGGVLGMGGAATVSLGASGAVFGLFAISVLTKLRFDFRKLLEAVILGQFVIERFLSEVGSRCLIGEGGPFLCLWCAVICLLRTGSRFA